MKKTAKKNLQTASSETETPMNDRYSQFMKACRDGAKRLGIKDWKPSNLQTASSFRDVTEGRCMYHGKQGCLDCQ